MNPVTRLIERWQALPASHKSLLSLTGMALLAFGYFAWACTQMPGATLIGYNHTERPIFSYFVNDNWGGNGGATCCWRIEGDALKVQWIKGRTGEQLRQGIKKETITRELPNPPRTRQDRYLHVHFFPGDQVRLAWSPNLDSPYEDQARATAIPSQTTTPDQSSHR